MRVAVSLEVTLADGKLTLTVWEPTVSRSRDYGGGMKLGGKGADHHSGGEVNMNGAHDLGGMAGFGPVLAEPNEPVFHADWERRVFGMVRVLGALGLWTGDMSRHARERQHPVDYLRHSYYENWLAGLEKILVENGALSAAELASGQAAAPADAVLRGRCLKAPDAAKALAATPATMPLADLPRFEIGETVRVLNNHPAGHTRCPRYVRGRTGVIHERHGGHIFPDLSAQGIRTPRHLYTIRFAGSELWGRDANANSSVYIDLWEDYLENAG